MEVMETSLDTNFPEILPNMGGGFPPYNASTHLTYETRQLEIHFLGRTHLLQEPVFIARKGNDASEGDGWVTALLYDHSSMSSELHIVDTMNLE